MNFRFLPIRDIGNIFTPYIGVGVNTWWYGEDKSRGKDKNGWKYGYNGVLGLRLLLDHFDLKNAEAFERLYGVRHTYLTLEAVYNRIDNLKDNRLDLSGLFYRAGVLFLF